MRAVSEEGRVVRAIQIFNLAVNGSDDLSTAKRVKRWCILSRERQQDDLPFICLRRHVALSCRVHDIARGTPVCGDEDAFSRFNTGIGAWFRDRRDDRGRR